MKEMIVKVLDSAFTYVLSGMILATITVLILSRKMIDVEWGVVMMGYATTLVLVAINMVLNDNYSEGYATKRTCRIAMWFMVLLFMASTIGLLIKVVNFLYAILHG